MRARKAREQLTSQFLNQFEVSLIDIGEDPEGKSDTPVLRVHFRQNATILADLPREVDGIPIRQVYGDYKLQRASKSK